MNVARPDVTVDLDAELLVARLVERILRINTDVIRYDHVFDDARETVHGMCGGQGGGSKSDKRSHDFTESQALMDSKANRR